MKRPIRFASAVLCFVLWAGCYRGHGLDPTLPPSGIRGRITFTGTRPDSTKEVRIAVLDAYPWEAAGLDTLGFVMQHLVVFSDPLPLSVQSHDYEIKLKPGIYGWIVVAWFPDIPNYIMGVKELGAFESDLPGKPASVTVTAGQFTEHIDIVADFANVRRSSPFF
ncbi:hypothetical protein JW906_03710 [bacterium]|nr:hypothetical protein [bacterium]